MCIWFMFRFCSSVPIPTIKPSPTIKSNNAQEHSCVSAVWALWIYSSLCFKTRVGMCPGWSEILVLPLIGQTIALSNCSFTSCTVVGIRVDQAAAQRTTRLKVTSKHHGLSPNCLVKMIRETAEQRLPSPALIEAALQRATVAPRHSYRLNKDM